MGENRKSQIRRDGWTPMRQLRFLDGLARTRSVVKAAAFAGMSRESAYRLRERKDGALFAALWDQVLQPSRSSGLEVHTGALSDRRLARLLGTHFRRNAGISWPSALSVQRRARPDRTRPL
jgi:hypothetical protein